MDKIHRRRQCSSCEGRFPSSERVDQQLLAREHHGGTDPDLTMDDAPPATFDNLRDAFLALWDDSATGTYSKRKWQRMELLLSTIAGRHT